MRVFTDQDYHHLRLIDCLKRSGLSIKDIKTFIDLAEDGDTALTERLEIFTKRREILRKELAGLEEVLGVIEYKCWYYETACKNGTEKGLKDIPLSEIPEQFRKGRENLRKSIV